MKQVYDAIQKLRATKSSKEKLAILTEMEDDADMQLFLGTTYNSRINFYISAIATDLTPMPWMAGTQFSADTIEQVVHSLAQRVVTGHAAKMWLTGLYQDLSTDWEKELLRLMIQRDVQAGISGSTINKVWPGLVRMVPYMRCVLPKDSDIESWDWSAGVYSQLKHDGMFANISANLDGFISIESRAGSPFPLDGFSALLDEVKRVLPMNTQLHGELLIRKPDGSYLPREEGNGLFNKLLQGFDLPAGMTPVYEAWDIIPLEAAVSKGKYDVPYKQRFEELTRLLSIGPRDVLRLGESKLVYSYEEARAHCKEKLNQKLEGTVVKHADGPWLDGDSKWQVKFKLDFEVDLKLVGFKAAAATSKNINTFGSLMFESEDGKLMVNVTGLKDAVRAAMHAERDSLFGTIHTVRANNIMAPSEDTGGFFSLFLPRWIERRLDKTKANTLDEIQAIQQAAIDAA